MSAPSDSESIKYNALQLEEDRVTQRRLWRIQRLAWWCFGLVIAAALAGFTGGGGYFSRQTLELGNASASFPRITRWQTADRATIRFAEGAEANVTFGVGFADGFSLTTITPHPQRSLASDQGLALVFESAGTGPRSVAIDFRATHPGWVTFDLSVDQRTTNITILVLP